MLFRSINIGSNPDDGTGDTLRTAFGKVNDNFTEVYNTAQHALPNTGGTIYGNMEIVGNLHIYGNTIYTTLGSLAINTTSIIFNQNLTVYDTPVDNVSILVNRGSEPNVTVTWNEISEKWTYTNDGSMYYYIPSNTEVESVVANNVVMFNSANGIATNLSTVFAVTNASFALANSLYPYVNTSSISSNVYSNTIGARANAFSNVIGSRANAWANVVGSIANNYAIYITELVGLSGNNWSNTYSNNVGVLSNTYCNVSVLSSNNYSGAMANASNAYANVIGVSGNAYSNVIGVSGNAYSNVIGVSGNAYANVVGVSGNAYSNVVGISGNVYVNVSTGAANNYAGLMANASNAYATVVGLSGNAYVNVSTDAANNYSGVMANAANAHADTKLSNGSVVLAGSLTTTSYISDSKADVRDRPINSKSAGYVAAIGDTGKVISTTGSNVFVTSSTFSSGNTFYIHNASGSNITITQNTGVTLEYAGGLTGNRTLSSYGFATVICVSTNVFSLSGNGIT